MHRKNNSRQNLNKAIKLTLLDYEGKFNYVIQSLKDDVSKIKLKFNSLKLELQVSKNITDNFTKYIKTLERKCPKNEQYSRREYLEISGITSSIKDSDADDCHRLKSRNNAPQKAIIKLSKRCLPCSKG